MKNVIEVFCIPKHIENCFLNKNQMEKELSANNINFQPLKGA